MIRNAFLGVICVLGALLSTSCPDDVEFVAAFPIGCEAEPVFELLNPSPQIIEEIDDPNAMLVRVDVGNFDILDKRGEPIGVCEGHFHVFINGSFELMMVSDQITLDVHALGDGMHTLTLQVHNNDHSRIEGIEAIEATFLIDVESN